VARYFSIPRSGLTCQVCGRIFQPPRSDAKYCSSACRQKAYRTRVTGKRPDRAVD
jgi:hypothetical protein